VLFGRFYTKAYIDDHKKKQAEKKLLAANNNVDNVKDRMVNVKKQN
jgi:hypothetical protein